MDLKTLREVDKKCAETLEEIKKVLPIEAKGEEELYFWYMAFKRKLFDELSGKEKRLILVGRILGRLEALIFLLKKNKSLADFLR